MSDLVPTPPDSNATPPAPAAAVPPAPPSPPPPPPSPQPVPAAETPEVDPDIIPLVDEPPTMEADPMWGNLPIGAPGERPSPKPVPVVEEPLELAPVIQPEKPPAKVFPPPVKVELLSDALWPVPEEVGGRTWLSAMALIAFIGLYAWILSHYYAGAHGGVDQAGYLMTARLLAGEFNPDAPVAPATPPPPPATRTATTSPATTAPRAITLWPGATSGYTDEHPQPAHIQLTPGFDWLRNRLSFVPDSPFQFASRMCIMTEPFGPAVPDLPGTPAVAAVPTTRNRPGTPEKPATPPTPAPPAEYRIYAKYPFGFPLLAAIGRDFAAQFDKTTVTTLPIPATRPATTQAAAAIEPTTRAAAPKVVTKAPAVGRGFDGMYWINPLCTILACYFGYFLFRQAVSPFVALIGVIWLAFNPLVLSYANDANSHSSTLLCVTLGFWGIISFLRTQQLWRAWIGGLALGYACTIRYSEGLLLLPVAFAAMVHFRFTFKRAIGSFSLLAAWAIPVIVLGCVCWVAFGSPFKTGYTYCNEDTGFGWKYLSGDYGNDRVVVGNWETFLVQVNRTGLFVLWPLALAGLFGMIGSAWRLGTILALWVFPSLLLYMLYYWAPGGETATGYLRFFVSIIPGLVFAGVWMLERALVSATRHAHSKWPGLIIGTLLGVFLLLVVAFYAEGGPDTLDGGLGKTVIAFASQTPSALWHLVKDSWTGRLCALVIVGAVVGMWRFDRDLIAARLGVALGAGAITFLGCGYNLRTIVPQVESAFARWTTLRVIVDNMRETLPRGTVVFCEDNLLNQLDCVGGWKLYNSTLFTPGMYQQSKVRVDARNNPDRAEDPDPIQVDRSRFYMELLAQPSSASNKITLGPRGVADLLSLQKAVIDKNVEQGHRITFLALTDAGDMGGGGNFGGTGGRITIPTIEGYTTRVLKKWTVSPSPSGGPSEAATPFGTRAGVNAAGRGRGAGAGRGGAGGRPFGILNSPPPATPVSTVAKQGATYVIYELIKRP